MGRKTQPTNHIYVYVCVCVRVCIIMILALKCQCNIILVKFLERGSLYSFTDSTLFRLKRLRKSFTHNFIKKLYSVRFIILLAARRLRSLAAREHTSEISANQDNPSHEYYSTPILTIALHWPSVQQRHTMLLEYNMGCFCNWLI